MGTWKTKAKTSYQEHWGMRKWAGVPRMTGEIESLSSLPTLGGAVLGPLSFCFSPLK